MSRGFLRRSGARLAGAVLAAGTLLTALPLAAQDAAGELPVRPWLDSLEAPPLVFDPPVPDEYELPGGVTVFHLRTPGLPIVNLQAHFRGGWSYLGRERYAAGTALPALLRNGGSRDFTPDEVDEFVEFHAVQTTFGGSGESVTSSLDVLVEHLDSALVVWGSILKHPTFDSGRIEVWAGQERESVRRRGDTPGRLAISEYNRLLYGDHPIGWEMTESDLASARLTPAVFTEVHRRIVCPDHLILGVTGPLPWEELRPKLERWLADWPPCTAPLGDAPIPEVGAPAGVYLIPRPIEQSVIIVGRTHDLAQGDTRAFFASRIGNAILGASGLSSRLNQRLRTELGWTYGATSLWTTPRRWEGVLGGTMQTRPEATVAATAELIRLIEGMATEAPTEAEIAARLDEFVNGWVFNFESAGQIVGRRIGFRAAELPDDWLTGYLEGMRAVGPEDVREVYRAHLSEGPGWVILIVGDPERFDADPAILGPVTILEVDGPPGG